MKKQWMCLDLESGGFFRADNAVLFDWNKLSDEQIEDIECCGEISQEILDTLDLIEVVPQIKKKENK